MKIIAALVFSFCLFNFSFAQIPSNTLVQIVKAEDERRYDSTLEKLLNHPDAKVRERAALAIGRIGNDSAIPALNGHLNDSPEVIAMVLFALGEIESSKGSTGVFEILQNYKAANIVRVRAIEAAGKIAAANPKDEFSIKLSKAIVDNLNHENSKRPRPVEDVILLGITAVLRAKPEGGEKAVSQFLDYSNARIRADALNALARLRSKSVNVESRKLLKNDTDAIVRANAARIFGGAEDKEALELLLNAATKDVDSRVRVSAIRALGNLKDSSVAEKIIPNMFANKAIIAACGATIEAINESRKNSKQAMLDKYYACNAFKNEYLEIATTLGRLLPNTNDQKAIDFLREFGKLDNYESPEIEIAFAKISPAQFGEFQINKAQLEKEGLIQVSSAVFQGIGELANAPDTEEIKPIKARALFLTATYIAQQLGLDQPEDKILSDAITAYAAFKTAELPMLLRDNLKHKDAVVRATVAGLLAEQPPSKENFEALSKAFDTAFLIDRETNDATLAILDALFKVNQADSLPIVFIALNSNDFLVRKKAFELMRKDDSAYAKAMVERAMSQKKEQVLPLGNGSKLGQILNTNADYARAVSRKNGTVKAAFTTSKGAFTIALTPEDAPLTVDNFIKLANSKYFNGLTVHRVVPNFVMQDGDPRGDGNGGPGWQIRCESNTLSYQRGAVGMALSGKDTGGSQWFATHAPQPHLDGGYTVFGTINETDMKIVDEIVRGDKILTVKIIGDSQPNKKRNSKRLQIR